MKRNRLWLSVIVALTLLAMVAVGVPSIPVASAQEDVEAETIDTIAALEGTLQDIYEEVNPSVVNIQVAGTLSPSPAVPEVPGLPLPDRPEAPIFGGGSGFVWDEEGHIVTNFHVIENADTIFVSFADGTTVEAEVVGTAPDVDLAVLDVDIPADELPEPVTVAESPDLRVGQLAIAIGNPFGQEGTMTLGIISALGRLLPVGDPFGVARFNIPDIIQTDAAINPGNSGGVLLNEEGELIGVTTAIFSPVQASVGIGFAVPSYLVEDAVPALIETGEFALPYLGVQGGTLTPAIAEEMGLDPGQRGALIVSVVPGGPAAEAGLQGGEEEVTINGVPVLVGGDVITAIEGEPVTSFDDVITYLSRNAEVGDTIELTILRDGEEETVEVTLEARPEAEQPPLALEGPPPQGPQLGILGLDVVPEIAAAMGLPEDQQGVLVESVEMGSPADEAGIVGSFTTAVINGQPVLIGGDVIVAFNGEEIAGITDLREALAEVEPGEEATVTVLRDGEEVELDVTFPEVDLEAEPAVEVPQGPQLGILGQDLTPDLVEELGLPEEQEGVVVQQVVPGTPAEEAGIEVDDVITAFDGEEVTTIQELRTAIQAVEPGTEATVTVLRDGEEVELDVTFPEMEEVAAAPDVEAPPTEEQAPRQTLGILAQDVTPEIAENLELPEDQAGVLVEEVEAGALAETAGLEPGDVIIGFNDEEIASIEALQTALEGVEPGEEVTLTVLRDGEEEELLVAFPEVEVTEEQPLLEEAPAVEAAQGPQLGILGQDLTADLVVELGLPDDQEGVAVQQVVAGTAAEEAGIEEGDVITTFNDEEITSLAELRTAVQRVEPGDTVTVTILRDGEEEDLEVTFPEPEE